MNPGSHLSSMAAVGRRFGKYELLQRIGQGGMAEVYRARSSGVEGFARTVVVKQILAEYASDKAFIDMLVAEAKICSALNHPNIVPIHDLGVVDGRYFIVMEYVAGTDLLGLLQACARKKRRVPTEIALYVISEVAKGLAHAHRACDERGYRLNIIHRDVSPSNVLVSRAGAVKLTDFGVARADLATGGGLVSTRTLKGKLGYLSPELVTGKPLDHRSDVFALGVILWEMLTLKRLLLGRNSAQTLLNVRDMNLEARFRKHSYIPAGIQEIIESALAKRPEDRFCDADSMADALKDYLFEHRLRVDAGAVARFVREMVDDPLESATPAEASPFCGQDSEDVDALLLALEAEAANDRLHQTQRVHGYEGSPEMAAAANPTGAADTAHGTVEGVLFGPLAANPFRDTSVVDDAWARITEDDIGRLRPGLLEGRTRALARGALGRAWIPRLFHQLAVAGADGMLELRRGEVRKEIFYRAGRVLHVNSTIRSELLATFLETRGRINHEQRQAALEMSRQRGIRLGAALVAMGAVGEAEIQGILQAQLRARFGEVFAWNEGRFTFFDGCEVPDQAKRQGTDTHALFGPAVRAHYSLNTLRDLFAPLSNHRVVGNQPGAVTAEHLNLNSEEMAFVPRLLGGLETTLRRVLIEPETEVSFWRTLLLLVQTGQVLLVR